MPDTGIYLARARLLEDAAGHGGRRRRQPWRVVLNPRRRVKLRSEQFGPYWRTTGEPWWIVERRCARCGAWQPVDAYPTDATRPGGIDPRCLACHRARRKVVAV